MLYLPALGTLLGSKLRAKNPYQGNIYFITCTLTYNLFKKMFKCLSYGLKYTLDVVLVYLAKDYMKGSKNLKKVPERVITSLF